MKHVEFFEQMMIPDTGLEKFHAKLFKKLSKLQGDTVFIDNYTTNEKAFSRDRALSIKTVTLLILQLLKSSLKTELKNFYTTVYRKDEVVNLVSTSALSQARRKIKYVLFSDLY